MMQVIVYIGGVRGVGKSTLFSNLSFHYPMISLSYEKVKISEKMLELLQRKKLIRKYEELETVNMKAKDDARLDSFKETLKNQKNLLFDGHYAVASSCGYSYGIPLEVIKNIDYFVLLYHDPRVILERRKKDASKKRNLNLYEIELDLKIEKTFANFYANSTGANLMEIQNDENAIIKVAKLLKEVKCLKK